MRGVLVLAGVLLGAVAAVVGSFVALIVGLSLAGAGSDRETGADVLFLLPFVLFALVSLITVVVPPVRRASSGLFAVAGMTSAVLLVAAGAVLATAGFQRL